jgi:hypothetical protein
MQRNFTVLKNLNYFQVVQWVLQGESPRGLDSWHFYLGPGQVTLREPFYHLTSHLSETSLLWLLC